jgi:hypothetical protein
LKKNITSIIYFIIAFINLTTSMVYFSGYKTSMGITYLCLAITFILLGIAFKKNKK